MTQEATRSYTSVFDSLAMLEKEIENSESEKNSKSLEVPSLEYTCEVPCLENGDKNEESFVDVHDDVSWDSTSLVGIVHDQALVEREDMLVRRVVIDSLVEVDDSQRDNLFYTRCMVLDRMYTAGVNAASCEI